MNTAKILFLAVCLCTSALTHAQIRLSFNPTQGETYVYRFSGEQIANQTVMGMEMPTTMTTDMLFAMTANSTNDNEVQVEFTHKEAGELSLRQTDTGYKVFIGDELFAGYITNFAGAPIIYPIVGPNGRHMTRDYPMLTEPYEGRNTSHRHQRSLWFAHGDVNGYDFWNAFNVPRRIVHQRFAKAESDGQTAVLVTENHWIAYDELLVSDVRTIRFSVSENKRIIDFDITITAEQESVTFGDNREGNIGIRVTEVLAAATGRGGQFVNAEGGVNEREAWGRRSAWINYHGEMDGERVGIAILNHPSSFRYPAYWHTREYGLFAANVFGVGEFERLADRRAGNHTLAQGESFTLRFRVIFHMGDVDIAEAFEEYRAVHK